MSETDSARASLISEAQSLYAKLQKFHKVSLSDLGVKLPNLQNKNKFNHRALQLVFLYKNLQKQVSKESVAAYVKSIEPAAAGDQQGRHLAYMGWDVRLSGKAKGTVSGEAVKQGHYVLASVDNVAPEFFKKQLKRLGRAAAKDWDQLQAAYDHRCACCGKKCEGKLEKGHKNPLLSQEIENIIPSCSECNNWAGDRFVFDDNGRVIALANASIIDSCEKQVQLAIHHKLKTMFGK
jgi:hypothetical protein